MSWTLFIQVFIILMVVGIFAVAIVSIISDIRKAKNTEIRELTEALRLTVEYVGIDILPPNEGWSWYEALKKYDPIAAEGFLRTQALRDRLHTLHERQD